MTLSIAQIDKPVQAKWLAKVTVTPDGDVKMHTSNADLSIMQRVEIAWYEDAIKVTVRDAGPMMLRQFYGTGSDRNVIVEVVPAD